MTDIIQPARHVNVFAPRRLRLTRVSPPVVSPRERVVMDRLWDEAVRANPHLYDGPTVAVMDIYQTSEELVLVWAPVTYRHFVLRGTGATCAPALFAAVIQPCESTGLLVGRTSAVTDSPGRVHLPGGLVEPPIDPAGDSGVLDLAGEAARELAEETGIVTPTERLELCLVTHAVNGNVGVIYRAPALRESVIREGFAAHCVRENAAGRALEFDAIDFVSTTDQLARMGGPYADSAIAVLRYHESATTSRR